MQKGFTLDDERLKQNGGRYFKELLQRIRDIRSSERNLWQQVTDIYATSIDYDKNAQLTKEFFQPSRIRCITPSISRLLPKLFTIA